MRQLKDVQILYAFHFDSLPKNEHETRARLLPRSLEFSKRRNDSSLSNTFTFSEFRKRENKRSTPFRIGLLVPSPETQSSVSSTLAVS